MQRNPIHHILILNLKSHFQTQKRFCSLFCEVYDTDGDECAWNLLNNIHSFHVCSCFEFLLSLYVKVSCCNYLMISTLFICGRAQQLCRHSYFCDWVCEQVSPFVSVCIVFICNVSFSIAELLLAVKYCILDCFDSCVVLFDLRMHRWTYSETQSRGNFILDRCPEMASDT